MARKLPFKVAADVHGWDDEAHLRCVFKIADVNALQALSRGEASPEQQVAALKWIVDSACMAFEDTFDAASQRNSDKMQGRRYVGLRIVAMTKILPGALADLEERRLSEEARKNTRSST